MKQGYTGQPVAVFAEGALSVPNPSSAPHRLLSRYREAVGRSGEKFWPVIAKQLKNR